jgi:glyoxylase-like metal-dependent hydrolase (beta-lactamase superfamily II)
VNRRELFGRAAALAAASLLPAPALAATQAGAVGRGARARAVAHVGTHDGTHVGTHPGTRVVAREPWGTLEEVGDGIWAMLSTPLTDRTTLCNGGLIAGRDGVLMIEAFGSEAGARWMTEQALALTGRRPSHVVVTHYHADHTAGLPAAMAHGGVTLHVTAQTRDLVLERNANPPRDLLSAATPLDHARETVLDLGARRVTLRPLEGHTGSDVAVWVEDAATLFAGDLVWYEMFPNFVDATPSRLSESVRALRTPTPRTVIPGHGTRTDAAGLDRFVTLLDAVEAAAQSALARGVSAEEAGRAFRMPAGMEDWTLFNARYFERAIEAWMRQNR